MTEFMNVEHKSVVNLENWRESGSKWPLKISVVDQHLS